MTTKVHRVERTRRTRAVPAVAAAAMAALVSGCAAGFDATSVQPYAPSDGVLADSGDLRVLNALVVASDSVSSGVISTTIVNRGKRPDRLTEVTSPAGTVDLTGDGDLEPGAALQLGAGTDTSATITGLTRLPGETITVKLTFRRAEPVTLRTVIVPAAGDYESVTPGPTVPVE